MNKKLFLSFGALIGITAPLAAVVACGPKAKTDNEVVADFLGAVKGSYTTTIKDKTLADLGIKAGETTTAASLGIKDQFPATPDDKTNVILTVESVTGETAKVKVYVKKGSAEDDKTFDVQGFKKADDTSNEDQKSVDDHIALYTGSYTTSKTTTRVSATGITNATTWATKAEADADLGVDLPTPPTGVTVAYKVTSATTPSGAAGVITVEVTASKGAATPKTATFTVTGWAAEAPTTPTE